MAVEGNIILGFEIRDVCGQFFLVTEIQLGSQTEPGGFAVEPILHGNARTFIAHNAHWPYGVAAGRRN
jgi:hypothetical protein